MGGHSQLESVPLPSELDLWMHLSDAVGAYYSLNVGDLTPSNSAPPPTSHSFAGTSGASQPPTPEWVFLEATLEELDQFSFPPEAPLRVVSIFISGDASYRLPRGSIGLDDITVKTTSSPDTGIVVEGFERASTWMPMPNAEVNPTVWKSRSEPLIRAVSESNSPGWSRRLVSREAL